MRWTRLWRLLPWLLAIPAAAAQPANPEQQRIMGLLQAIGRVGQRRAGFIEEKTLAAINGRLVSSGRLDWIPPDHLEQRTLQPHPEDLVADGNRLTMTEGDEAARVIDLASQPEIRALVDTVRATLSGDARLLQFYYAIELAGDDQAWELTLHPVAPQVVATVREVMITGHGSDPLSIETIQTNGDTTRLTIEPPP